MHKWLVKHLMNILTPSLPPPPPPHTHRYEETHTLKTLSVTLLRLTGSQLYHLLKAALKEKIFSDKPQHKNTLGDTKQ